MTYLGIDIGGTKVALRAEQDGRPAYEASFTWPASGGVAQDLDALGTHLKAVRERWGEPIERVGVAIPATVDAGGRVVTWPGRPTWVGLELPSALAELLPGVTVRWGDDGDLAALAEARAAGYADVVYLGVGTGVGGGVVLGGRPVPGLDRGSAEIGHIVIDRAGPACDCGRHGCLQAVASGPATLRRAARLRRAAVDSTDLREALGRREEWAVAAVGEACDALAAAVVSLNELLRPAVAIVGGGFAAAFPGFAEMVAERAARWARPGHPPPPVRPAALGGLSSLHGALLLAREAGGWDAPGRGPAGGGRLDA